VRIPPTRYCRRMALLDRRRWTTTRCGARRFGHGLQLVTHRLATALGFFHRDQRNIPLVRIGSRRYLTVFTCEKRHKACPGAERLDQMQHPSTSITRRPVVLLVQPSRDEGLEMYTEFALPRTCGDSGLGYQGCPHTGAPGGHRGGTA